MADILIRGMEMPQRCKACRFCGFGGRRSELNVCMFTGESQPTLSQERMSKCPLVPLPEGHGRPIDADELMVKIKTESDFIEANFIRGRDKVSFALAVKQELYRVMEIVEKMPTIKKDADNG